MIDRQMYYAKKLFWLMWLSLFSCKNEIHRSIPDVSHIKETAKIHRYEEELFGLDTLNLSLGFDQLTKKYPAFTRLYFEKIISLTDSIRPNDPIFIKNVLAFLGDSSIRSLYDLSQKHYANFNSLEKELSKSCQFFKYYFPDESTPEFYTLISEYSVGSFIFQDENKKNALGIGLDFYLGNAIDYKQIDPKNPAFSDYLSRSFNKDHLIKKTWESWVDDRLGLSPGQSFLDNVIHGGKKLYILSSFIPEMQDSVLFDFSSQQLKWCKENELAMWSFFLDKDLIYSTDQNKFKKYVNPSPNSPGMPPDAPGQTGNFIGYQIVSTYMAKHPEISLAKLIMQRDALPLFKEAKYRPK